MLKPCTVTRCILAIILLVTVAGQGACKDQRDHFIVHPDTWTSPQKIVGSSSDSHRPCIAIDSNDVAHIAWEEEGIASTSIYYTNSSIFGTNINISNSIIAARNPKIAIDSNNTVYIGWAESWDGYPHTHIANSTDWTGTKTFLSPSADLSSSPILAIDSNNVVHAIWVESTASGPTITDWWVEYANSTDWTGTKATIIHPTMSLVGWAMAVDSNGVIHVTWTDLGTGPYYDIWYANSTDWSATHVNVSEREEFSWNPMMLIDSNDVVHIFWEQDIVASPDAIYRANSTDWAGSRSSTNICSSGPSIAIDSSNVIHMVVQEPDFGYDMEIFYCNSIGWPATWTNISNTKDRAEWWSLWPSIAVNSGDVVHIVWEEQYDSNNSEVWYTRLAR